MSIDTTHLFSDYSTGHVNDRKRHGETLKRRIAAGMPNLKEFTTAN